MSDRHWLWLALGVAAIQSHALFLPGPLPMNDASSHVATAHIALRLLQGDAFFVDHYAIDLIPTPYWLSTLLLTPLLALGLSPLVALKVATGLGVFGLPAAFWLLARRVHPGAVALTPLVAIVGVNASLFEGELNYVLGQPLVLLATWAFAGLERVRSGRFLAFTGLAIATYLAHVFALAILALLLGCLVLQAIAQRWGAPSLAERLRPLREPRGMALLVPIALLGVATYWILVAPGEHATQGALVWGLGAYRFKEPVLHLVGSVQTELGTWLWAGPLLMAAAVALLLGRRPTVAAGPALAAAIAGALATVGPVGMEDALGFEDIADRFELPAVVLSGLAVGPVVSGALVRRAFIGLTLALGCVRAVDVAAATSEVRDRLAVLDGQLGQVPPHARVLPLWLAPPRPSFADFRVHRTVNSIVTSRDGYSPHVFARSGQQPLRHRHWPEYRLVENLEMLGIEWAFYDVVLIQSPSADTSALRDLEDRAACDPWDPRSGFRVCFVRPGRERPSATPEQPRALPARAEMR